MKAFLLLIHSVLLLQCGAQEPTKYKIHVQLPAAEGKAFIRYFTTDGPRMDSVRFEKGNFIISGKMPAEDKIARLYWITSSETEPAFENSCEVFLQSSTINITSPTVLFNATYKGTEQQLEFSELHHSLRPNKKREHFLDQQYYKAEADKDEVSRYKLINESYPALYKERQKLLEAFIRKHPSSVISALKFEDFMGQDIDLPIIEPVYALLDERIKQHPTVKAAAAKIGIAKRTAPGMEAPLFSQQDTSGKDIPLSFFRGKYLFIDFWASWCRPCRAENPLFKKLFAQYRNNNFHILGVSLDGERKAWTKAIVHDSLEWSHVSDLQIFDNAVAKQYGISEIPQNLLIGPDGKIIAKNLHGEVLEKKLKDIFKK